MQVIFVSCWLSAALFMSHIFDGMRWISIPTGVIWALLVTNLYLLLLYTISPALLPVAKKKTLIQKGKKKKVVVEEKVKQKNPFLSFSFLFRIGLITFLAIIIAQPINVWFFASNYEEGDRFAEAIKDILIHNQLSWIITTLFCLVMLLPVYFKYSVRKVSENNFEDDFESKDSVKGLKHLREQLGNPTDFENLSKQILSTNINLIRTSDFYFQKSLIEHRIILEEYEHFKKEYASVLVEKNKQYNESYWKNLMPVLNKIEKINPEKYRLFYDELEENLQDGKFEKYEYWADPPFRTKYNIAKASVESETELLQTFYKEKNNG